MKMREYIDDLRGNGYWDQMMDSIEGKQLFVWEMPVVKVDGRDFHIFPGSNREVTLEEVRVQISRSLADAMSRRPHSLVVSKENPNA